LLTRAVTNLISNAIKYSPAGKEITINARAEGQALRIEVVDQGYGIPAADLERIFEKFYRVSRAEDTDVQGTGLGLAFVREIVELHGGRVTVSSVAGSGSTFSLLLPPLNSGAATE
jgi:two-component system sensor histidine kinase SenX3